MSWIDRLIPWGPALPSYCTFSIDCNATSDIFLGFDRVVESLPLQTICKLEAGGHLIQLLERKIFEVFRILWIELFGQQDVSDKPPDVLSCLPRRRVFVFNARNLGITIQ